MVVFLDFGRIISPMDLEATVMIKPYLIPRCVGLFPSDGSPCPHRDSCLHYTDGTDQHAGYWVPRVEGYRCFDRETDLGATVGRVA